MATTAAARALVQLATRSAPALRANGYSMFLRGGLPNFTAQRGEYRLEMLWRSGASEAEFSVRGVVSYPALKDLRSRYWAPRDPVSEVVAMTSSIDQPSLGIHGTLPMFRLDEPPDLLARELNTSIMAWLNTFWYPQTRLRAYQSRAIAGVRDWTLLELLHLEFGRVESNRFLTDHYADNPTFWEAVAQPDSVTGSFWSLSDDQRVARIAGILGLV